MTEKLKQIIEEETKKLPPEWQKAIHSLDWIKISEEVGKKYLLSDNEINDLQTETGLVMVGLENQELYALNIESNVGTSKDESINIANEIDQKIFTPIKQNLSPSNFNIAENKINDSKPVSHFVDLQKAIEDSDYKTKTYTIGQKYHLAIDQMGVLEEIVNKTILGSIHPDKIDDEIKSKIQIPEDKINELINDLNEEIFKDIRDLLKNQSQTNIKETEEIPLPPYSSVVNNKEQVVSINDPKETEIPVPEIKNEEILNNEQEIDEDEIFRNSGIDIIGEKLNKPTVSTSTISNHSLPKINSDKNSQTNDPYREEI